MTALCFQRRISTGVMLLVLITTTVNEALAQQVAFRPVASEDQLLRGARFKLIIEAGDEAQPVQDIFGISLDLAYDPARIRLVDAEPGSLLRQGLQEGALLLELDQFINLEPGRAPYSVTRTRPQSGVSGYGPVVVFEAEVLLDAPGGGLTLTLPKVKAVTPLREQIASVVEVGEVTINPSGLERQGRVLPGNPESLIFDTLGLEVDYRALDAEAVVRVQWYRPVPPEHLPEHYLLAQDAYWHIIQKGAASYNADVCFSLEEISDSVDHTKLEVLTRVGQSWQRIESELRPSEVVSENICGLNVTRFGTYVVALQSVQVDVEQGDPLLSETYVLTPSYPNPFNSSATFTLKLRRPQQVRIVLYDVWGQQIRLLHEGYLAANQIHSFMINGHALSSGLYAYTVFGERFRLTRSALLVK